MPGLPGNHRPVSVRWFLGAVPFFAPGMLLWAAFAIVAGSRVGRALKVSSLHGALLILALGLVLMATLPPTGAALSGQSSFQDFCDTGRITPASLSMLSRLNETSLNVLLFVPLGLSLGALAGSRRKLLLLALAFALPIAIELYQLSFPALGRGCQTADVIDNLTGLIIGLAMGFAWRWLTRAS